MLIQPITFLTLRALTSSSNVRYWKYYIVLSISLFVNNYKLCFLCFMHPFLVDSLRSLFILVVEIFYLFKWCTGISLVQSRTLLRCIACNRSNEIFLQEMSVHEREALPSGNISGLSWVEGVTGYRSVTDLLQTGHSTGCEVFKDLTSVLRFALLIRWISSRFPKSESCSS